MIRDIQTEIVHLKKEKSCDYAVAGNSARIEYGNNRKRFFLKKAIDDTKRQSYVLYYMTQHQLEHTRFNGLIIQGGESTVQGNLIYKFDLLEPSVEKIKNLPSVFVTCAGLLLLAEKFENDAF